MSLDRKYLVWALSYAAIGMCLGIFMAASDNHTQTEAHSHALLVGFVLSFCYGAIHKLWLAQPKPVIAKAQFVIHQAGAATMAIGLFMFYGDLGAAELLGPILGISSIAVLAGALLMFYMVLKENAVKT
jgi:hypothetical protein